MQEKTITSCMEQQEHNEAARKMLKATRHRNVMLQVVDFIILLGIQGLSFRGHRESIGILYHCILIRIQCYYPKSS